MNDRSTTIRDAAAAVAAPPDAWASDVVLADGGTVHIRTITPGDATALVEFHEHLSPESVHFRFFGPHPRLSPREVARFTTVEPDRRVALVAELGDRLIAVGRYERDDSGDSAEVAFVVADEHQGRGIGTVLLEDLATIARQHGIVHFVADTLATNSKMLRVFRNAGFGRSSHLANGVVRVEMTIEPTEAYRAAAEQREHRAEATSITRLLTPGSVAVIGASRDPNSVGHHVVSNLLDAGFAGPIYPVNRNATTIAGLQAYRSMSDLDGRVDLAVIAVPAAGVLDTVEQCGTAGVTGAVVLTAGFGEVGADGGESQQRLRAIARRHGIRLVGPNCIGVLNTATGLDATFASHRPVAGSVAMQSQSGAIGIALLEFASRIGVGVSSFVSVGNKSDVSGNDLLQFWEDDAATDVILLYLESFGNPRKFARLARRVSRRKPIVALKSGRTAAGTRAASSHTAALAASDDAVDALFRQAGITRVDRIDELFDMAVMFDLQPLPRGTRIAIVGNSGGPGVLAADACAAWGLDLVELSATTQEALGEIADPNATLANPVDLVASATPETFERAVELVLADPGVDGVVTICTPTLFAPPSPVAAALRRAGRRCADKPLLAAFLAWPQLPAVLRDDTDGSTDGVDLPAFSSPEPAIAAFARAERYASWRRRDPGVVPWLDDIAAGAAADIVERALSTHPEGTWLDPGDATELLQCYGVPVCPSAHVTGEQSALLAADGFGYPVALKAAGADLVHKSDVGGVALDLTGADAVRAAMTAMRRAIGDDASGFVVQPMIAGGVETIVGVVQDPLFGPLLMFGMGGTTAELLRDRALRILPVTAVDAHELVRSLRCSPLLFGYRGAPAADVERLEDLLVRVGRLAADLPQVTELDLNPVIVNADGPIVVDAKVRVTRPPAAPPEGFRTVG